MMFKTTILLLFFPLFGISQTLTREGQIWLANSRGEAVGQADTVVTRNFFDAEWVDIRADFMIDPTLDCWFIIQPDSGSAKAYKFPKREMALEALNGIANNPGPANLILVFQPSKPTKSGPKGNKLVFRLL